MSTEKKDKPITFTCEGCGGVFPYSFEEEAANEFKENFGREVTADDAIICDDCYKKIMPEIQN